MKKATLSLLLLGGCAHGGLAARVSALEARLQTLEIVLRTTGAAPAAAMTAMTTAAQAAQADPAAAMLADATRLAREGRVEEPRTLLRELISAYPESASVAAARRLYAELQVVGQPAAGLDGTVWLQGAAPMDAPTQLYIFFETWCPHCRNHLPKVQAQANVWADNGLSVVALTRMTRDVTPEQVLALAGELGLRLPIGRATEALWQSFAVSGVPAAAVVRDGTIVWRGHPANLSDDLLREWMPAATPPDAGPDAVPQPTPTAPTAPATEPSPTPR